MKTAITSEKRIREFIYYHDKHIMSNKLEEVVGKYEPVVLNIFNDYSFCLIVRAGGCNRYVILSHDNINCFWDAQEV